MLTLSKPKILIVDDVPANIRLLEAALTPDYEISAATVGREALEITHQPENLPDLILLDIMMPGMDGYEVCRILKSEETTRNIPVIFITARTEEEEETKGFDLGAVDYITKPFSPAVVKARVNTHTELKRHRDRLERLNARLRLEVSERMRSEDALKELLKKQEMDIGLAKKMLHLIAGSPPRYIPLSDSLILFTEVISVPCHAEGGDHYFVQYRAPEDSGAGKAGRPDARGKTVLSLKDQSGHEVGCVLRSIVTDLIHKAVLNRDSSASAEEVMTELNNEICYSEVFGKEDFITAVFAEIYHENLMLRFVSAGHPPFLLIRGNSVHSLPESGGPGTNIPLAVTGGPVYSAGEYLLEEGDKLIFYTDGLVEMPLRNRKKTVTLQEAEEMVADIIRNQKAEYHQNPGCSEIMYELLDRISDLSDERIISGAEPKNTSADDVTLLGLEIENRNGFFQEILNPRDAEEISGNIKGLYENIKIRWYQLGYESPELRLRLVMEESVLNAWKHGNRKDPNKTITLRWRFGNDFHLEVEDQGGGFDYCSVPDPTSAERFSEPGGRGLFMIRYFSDGIRWEENGRRIVVFFRKHPDLSEKERIRRTEKLRNMRPRIQKKKYGFSENLSDSQARAWEQERLFSG